MGEFHVEAPKSGRERHRFMVRLLRDLAVLEQMIAEGTIESGVRRIGAEQEMFLVDRSLRPLPEALAVLDELAEPQFTTEMGRFNLELNLDPLDMETDCLSRLEDDLGANVGKVRSAARQVGGGDVALTGILPTLRTSDLGLDNMVPLRRYEALNEALAEARGGPHEVRLEGIDEIALAEDSVMLETCCTSFQLHLQVDAEEFPRLYNLAQLITAPVLAAAANSPVLFGRRLWHETRVPLFQQSIDTRTASFHLRQRSPRVFFGRDWIRGSALEVFREGIARFGILVGTETDRDPAGDLAEGRAPDLLALQVHNGTIWRWNRCCYGITRGVPHLRIEMRALPSGPSVLDEVANAALAYGLLLGLGESAGDVTDALEFADVRSNFLSAARDGLHARLRWLDGETRSAQRLLLDELIPLAEDGLRAAGIAAEDRERYLGVVERRVASGRNGAGWILESIARMRQGGSRVEVLEALTAAMVENQKGPEPVHEWPLARVDGATSMGPRDIRVEEFMSTDLFTVEADDPIELVGHLMEWEEIRHVPVEAEDGRLVGIVSAFEVIRYLNRHGASATAAGRRDETGERADRTDDDPGSGEASATVQALMRPVPATVEPETSLEEALALMRRHGTSCLPVLDDGRLVGIVTEHDVTRLVARSGEG